MSKYYTKTEIFNKLHECKDEYGVCSPRKFRKLDDAPEVSAVLSRFDSWKEAKEAAGIREKAEDTRDVHYSNAQLLSHLHLVDDHMDTVSPKSMLEMKQDDDKPDVASPSVVIERFGSWLDAKRKAGFDIPDDEHGDRVNNGREKEYSNEEYMELLQTCEEKYGKVTQRLFNQMRDESDEKLPSASAVGKRFGSWSTAKDIAGVIEEDRTPGQQYSKSELIEMLQDCADEHEKCTASVFKEHYVSIDVIRDRFGSWNAGKEAAGLDTMSNNTYSDEELLKMLAKCKEKHGKVTAPVFNDDDAFEASATTVARRFDSWSDAKQKAEELMEDDELTLTAA